MSNADDVGRLSHVRAYAPIDLSLCSKGKKRKEISQFVGVFLIRFLTSAKGVVVPWWQCELGLGVANISAAVKSALGLNLFFS